jgi:type III secretion system chaperone SycN
MEKMGTLGIEHHGKEVVVYLLRQMPPGDLRFLRRALALCHYKEGHPFPLQAGMKGEDQLVFLVRIPEREFSVQTIEQSIELLDRLHGAAA